MAGLTSHHGGTMVTKAGDKLKPPPGLEKLKLPQFDQLALPPHLKQFFQGRSVPRPVLQDALDWLAAHKHDGDPQVVRQVRAWLAEQRLDPLMAAELRQVVAALKPKGYDTARRNVLCSIMRGLFPPDGLVPDDVSTYRLAKQIKPLWAETWCRLYPERKQPLMPGKGTVADARAALKNLPR